jgi:hypothetical protein
MSLAEDIEPEPRVSGYSELARQAEKGYWRTRDGKRLKIEDMSDQHIINVRLMFGIDLYKYKRKK